MKAVTLESIAAVIRTRRGFKTFLSEFIQQCGIVDAIPIPDGATNGDMMKTMFPDIESIETVYVCGIPYVRVLFKGQSEIKIFDLDWWNAPYKKEV